MLCFKNDGIFSHYPIKYFIGESFANGHIPFWNAFINWGYPQYADLSGAWWNPITWATGIITHYPIWAFHAEQILYIFIAALGLRKLLLYLHLSETIALIGAISYISSGYITEHYLYKEWICAVAFLPWCMLYLKRSLDLPGLKNNTKWAAVLFLFIASAHPSLSIALLYLHILILLFAVYKCWASKKLNRNLLKRQTVFIGVTITTFIILALGMALSYAEVIPFLVRGEKISETFTRLPVGTTWQSWVTLLAPLPGIKNNEWFGNWTQDAYMSRNCFIGSIIIAALLPIKKYKFIKIEALLWILTILFFCLSSVIPFRLFAFKYLPLFGFTQMNGIYRIFTMFFLIILACYRLNHLLSKKDNVRLLIKNIKIITGIYVLVLLIGLFLLLSNSHPGINLIIETGVSINSLKKALYTFNNIELWLIQGILGVVLTVFLLIVITKNSLKWICIPLIIEGAAYASIFLPFSSLQSQKQQQVQKIIHQRALKDWNISLANTVNEDAITLKREFRHPNIFTHQTYQDSIEECPMMFNNVKTLLPNHRKWISQPHAIAFYKIDETVLRNDTLYSNDFLKDSSYHNQSEIVIQDWHAIAGKISFLLKTNNAGYCVIMQSYYPGWTVLINGNPGKIQLINGHFIGVAVGKGQNKIELVFRPGWKAYWFIISFSTLTIIFLSSLYDKRKFILSAA